MIDAKSRVCLHNECPSLALLFFLSPSVLLRLDTKSLIQKKKEQTHNEDAVALLVSELPLLCNPRKKEETPIQRTLGLCYFPVQITGTIPLKRKKTLFSIPSFMNTWQKQK